MTVSLYILLIFLCPSPIQNVAAFIDADQVKKDSTLQQKVEKNNGDPIPVGHHSYLVLFMKKSSFDEKLDDQFSKQPTDFSLKGPFFSSGTLVTSRWAITRAKPIAYYPIGSYWMVAQQSIPLPVPDSIKQSYEIDTVLIHPDHKSPDNLTDIALVRTSEIVPFDFEARNINMAIGDAKNFSDCQLPVWSFLFPDQSDKKEATITRSHIVLSQAQDCTNGALCYAESETKHRPCGINSAAPIICGPLFVGVYVGNNGDATCSSNVSTPAFRALRLDEENTKKWIETILTDPDLLTQTDTDDEDTDLILDECPNEEVAYKMCKTLFVIVFLKYTI